MPTNYSFSDIRGDFRRNPVTNDLDIFIDEESISNSIRNIVFFAKNSVVFRPTLAADIESYLFEPLSPITARSIQDAIQNAVGVYEPRIEQLSVDVNMLRDVDGYQVIVSYLPKKSIDRVEVVIFLERSV